MIRSITQAQEIAGKYNALKTDRERLSFLKENNEYLKVVLDNDQTMVNFITKKTAKELNAALCDINLNDFDKFHGWEEGVIELFEFAGITVEGC